MFKSNAVMTSQRSAKPAATFSAEVFLTARLGAPLAFGELGWMSTYIVDALMIGRMPHSALAISASSLGNTIFYAIAFCAIGLLTGLETLVAQAFGRGDREGSTRTLTQAFWFVVVTTPVVMLATLAAVPLLPLFGISAELVAETKVYLNSLIWSTAPLLLYWALRRYLQSIDRVLLIMVSLITAGAVNAGADWVLIYGHLGLPALGLAGSGWATCLVRVYALLLVLLSLRLGNRGTGQKLTIADFRFDFVRSRSLFKIGWPAALQSLADLGVSTFLSILCAQLGTTLLAAHQVVLDLNAVVYMVPLGLSYATATRVGQSAGRRNVIQVRRAAKASILLGLGFTLIAGFLFVISPHFLASLYTNDVSAVAAAAPIFLLCGFIQIGDATGIIFSAALVGVGDTRTPLIAGVFWSWIVGMPFAYFLTFNKGWGLQGLWSGRLIAAAGFGATLSILWLYRLRNKNTILFKPSLQSFSTAAGS